MAAPSTSESSPSIDYVAFDKLSKDLRKASKTLSQREARYLVNIYYSTQETRKRLRNQCRALENAEEPHEVLQWFFKNNETFEKQIAVSLDVYSANDPVGSWMRSVKGIGPVIAAGFLAHIDIEKAPTVGHIWAFAGLDPTKKWLKGQKRPWNAKLKVLCWKASSSFVKTSGGENPGYYGVVYRDRKALEVQRNEAGAFAEQAAEILRTRKFKDGPPMPVEYCCEDEDEDGGDESERDKEAEFMRAQAYYAAGKLPPGHLDMRARRYAVKLFLAHLHDVWYREHFKKPPPLPYPIAILGHAHYIPPPAKS